MRTVVRIAFFSFLVVDLGLFVGCGGGSSSGSNSGGGGSGGSGGGTTNNVQPIAVNGGPVPGQIYPNGAFTSIVLCVPGTSTCETVDGILVDTGSVGLRVLRSAIPNLNLPLLTGPGNTTINNCVSFVDSSFLWGEVAQADVKMAGEVASAASVQLIADPTGFSVPSACSNGGMDESTQAALGTNGILGVGPEPDDCGPVCVSNPTGPPNRYFSCALTGNCSPTFLPEARQVVNPIVLFAKDNNGVLIEMQSVSGAAATASGSMIFGIGTESNNQLGSATVFTLDDSDDFTTNFNGHSLNSSFIDSGSNGLFFPDDSIPACAQNSTAPGFDCPPSTVNRSAQNVGANSAQNTVNFSVDNAVNLFQTSGSDAAFTNLAGPNTSGTCSGQNPGACSFDWGLPFFFGRTVFTSIDGQAVPMGVAAAPWWAY